MKSGVTTGAIAGIVAGIVGIILVSIFVSAGLAAIGEQSIIRWFTVQIGFNLIWGVIFGVIYSKAYDVIPRDGVMKGLCFGLLIWLIHSIYPAAFFVTVATPPMVAWATSWVIGGFVVRGLAYGSVLGVLYKK